MLNSVNLNDKTYDELLTEAIAQIPLYSKEWTNYNVSDPGITMLQNLTAFQLLQQESIDVVPEEAQRNLLKLVGYTGRENRAATIMVQALPQGGDILPEGHRLWSGTIPFETEQTISQQPWGLAAVYSQGDGNYRELTRLLGAGSETVAYPFGRKPVKGNALVCVLHGVPEVGEKLNLYLQIAEEELRAPFLDETEIPVFSRVRWQYYTDKGWTDARFTDGTMGMLRSGVVSLWLEQGIPEPLEETAVKGCALRCVLETAEFDRIPRLRTLAVHLFPMVQKMTRVMCASFPGREEVTLRGSLPMLGAFFVFAKETPEGPYYRYQKETQSVHGERVFWEEESLRRRVIRFPTVPCGCENGIRVVCFDEEMIHHRWLDPVYGYDGQIIPLHRISDVLPEQFMLAVEEIQPDGEAGYWFVRPGELGPEGFRYHLRSQQAQIVIDDPGAGGYRLFLACCATTQGKRGNLRAGAVLEQRGGYDGTEVEQVYNCPAPGWGGVSRESVEELRVRFSEGMRRTCVAVRAEDYEALVRETPGLCIHKVKAVAFGSKNLVKIAVKPYTEEELPILSLEYRKQIQKYLEPRRMLTTRFEICQPRYVPVGVSASLSIRGMAAYAQEEAEQVIREYLDHVNNEKNFGEWIRFNELYQKLSALPFVDAVDALSLFPESRDAVLNGSDIHLEDDSLCYPGTIRLTIREYGR